MRSKKYHEVYSTYAGIKVPTLESGINVAPFIPYTYTTKIGSMKSGIRP